jgi:tetratricopeptide (TPR) repeat protein
VSTHRHCPLTHSLLTAGRCGFCNQPVVKGQVVPDGPGAVPDRPRWNVSALLAALAGEGDAPANALGLVAYHNRGDIFDELPVFRAALGHPQASVRHMAEFALGRYGRRFQTGDAERCEQHLCSHPEESALRVALVVYYSGRSHYFPEAKAARLSHILWFIEHLPDSDTAKHARWVFDNSTSDAYQRGRELWLRHTESEGASARVLGNAAGFFAGAEPDLSERLYTRARELEPDNPEWVKGLAFLQKQDNRRLEPAQRGRSAAAALSHLEEAYRLSADDAGRAIVLVDLAKAAFDAGERARAARAAEELLRVTAKPFDAKCAHAGHTLLGRLALRDGNVEEAKRHLRAAGEALARMEGARHFLPSELWLAKELLERGERGLVVDYLRTCSTGWHDPNHCGEVWAVAIERGEMPDFGRHLE